MQHINLNQDSSPPIFQTIITHMFMFYCEIYVYSLFVYIFYYS